MAEPVKSSVWRVVRGWRALESALKASACVLLLAAVGCSSASEQTCATRFECDSGQVCLGGVCEAPAADGSCAGDNECLIGQVCVGRLCVADDGQANNTPANNTPANNTPNNNTPRCGDNICSAGETAASCPADCGGPANNDDECGNGICNSGEDDENCPEDCEPDREPPRVAGVSPGEGQVGISTNEIISVTFTEPVRDFGLEQKILISNADTLASVETVASINGNTVTLQPTSPLDSGTPYQVLVTSQISDLRGNRLPDDFRWYFSTAVSPEAEHAQLAERFAPVIFQEVDPDRSRGRADYFSLINFDGNFNAADNLLNFRTTDQSIAAYYAVVETITHVYLQYLYYFPSYYNNVSDEYHEHDLTAVQVVLARDGGDLRFVMAETGYRNQQFGFAAEGEGIASRNQGNLALTFPRAALIDDRHAPIYIGRNFHGACHWLWEPGVGDLATAPWCSHPSEGFRDDEESVVFYPGAGSVLSALSCDSNDSNACAPESGVECVSGVCRDGDGQRAQTYGLEDFRENLWVRRVNISGQDQLFNGRATYSPHPSTPNRPGSEDSRKFPATLETEDTASRGEMPFIQESPGAVSPGQWWVDPAYSFGERFRFGENNDGLSATYCYNPWFNIDVRGEGDCP